ncbi:MAG: ATP-binding protein [Thermoplasmatota archaeon]
MAKLSSHWLEAPETTKGHDPRTSAPQLLSIIQSLPDVIFRCEKRADGKIYWTLNEGRLAEEFHLTTDAIKDKPLEALFPPETAARLLPEFERAFRGEGREFTNELFGRHFKHYPQPVFGPGGKVVAVIGFISEVTSLVKAEQAIKALNAELSENVDELAAANRELDAFSASVSHDLRTPLTAIDSHAQVLQEAEGPRLTDTGRRSLEKVRTAVRQMNLLIQEILQLSRSTSAPLKREPVDLGSLARTLAMDLPQPPPGRSVEWVIAHGLVADADPQLVRAVLQNLLGNAWKYSSKREHARIEVGKAVEDGHTAYFVRDNGVGFDMKDAPGLFRAFSRLPSSAAGFEGTGIGLATVKRIVQRHGGRVWAKGSVGRGATFYFTL